LSWSEANRIKTALDVGFTSTLLLVEERDEVVKGAEWNGKGCNRMQWNAMERNQSPDSNFLRFSFRTYSYLSESASSSVIIMFSHESL
jgi:hypothetical protein